MEQSMTVWRNTTAGWSTAAGRRASVGPSAEVGPSGTAGQSAVVCLVAGQVGPERLRCGRGVDVGLRCGGNGTTVDGDADVVAPWLAAVRWRGGGSVGTARRNGEL